MQELEVVMTAGKQCALDETGLEHIGTYGDHGSTWSSQPDPSTERKKKTQSPAPTQDTIGKRHLLGKGKPVFSNGKPPCMSSTLQSRPHAQEWSTITNLTE